MSDIWEQVGKHGGREISCDLPPIAVVLEMRVSPAEHLAGEHEGVEDYFTLICE